MLSLSLVTFFHERYYLIFLSVFKREEREIFWNNKFRERLILWEQKQLEWKSLILTNEKDVADDIYKSIIWFKKWSALHFQAQSLWNF